VALRMRFQNPYVKSYMTLLVLMFVLASAEKNSGEQQCSRVLTG
jgi:hypothetical protein